MTKRPLSVAILMFLCAVVAVVWTAGLVNAVMNTTAQAWSGMALSEIVLWFSEAFGTIAFSAITAIALFKRMKSSRRLGMCWLFLVAIVYLYGMFFVRPREPDLVTFRLAYSNPHFGLMIEALFKLLVAGLLFWWGWQIGTARKYDSYFVST